MCIAFLFNNINVKYIFRYTFIIETLFSYYKFFANIKAIRMWIWSYKWSRLVCLGIWGGCCWHNILDLYNVYMICFYLLSSKKVPKRPLFCKYSTQLKLPQKKKFQKVTPSANLCIKNLSIIKPVPVNTMMGFSE